MSFRNVTYSISTQLEHQIVGYLEFGIVSILSGEYQYSMRR